MAKKSSSPVFIGTPEWNTWLFSILAFLLIFAPIIRGGNRPLALLVINIAAMGLMAVLLWQPGCLRKLPLSILLIAVLALLGTAVMLVPIPKSLWLTLPGRGLYSEGLRLVGEGDAVWRPISISPHRTEAAWFKLFTYIAVFLATYYLPIDWTRRLVFIVISVAGAEAALGLMQRGTAGKDSILSFGIGRIYDAIGTYANRDHLAGFLVMVTPVVIGLLVGELGQGRSRSNRNQKRRDFFTSVRGQRSIFLALVLLLIILGIVFTRSRAGIALLMFSLVLSMFAFAWRLGGSNVYGTVGSVIAISFVLAAEIGLLPVLDRFSLDPMQDARVPIFTTTIDGIGQFFPLGSGAGTFPLVYPAFQPVELGGLFIHNAHNDFLETIFEQGMLAVVLIAWALLLYFARWRKVWIKDTWGAFRFIQVGSGIAVLALILHSLGDFNLRIPANAIFFTFFAGIFFKHYDESATSDPKKRGRRHHRSREGSTTAASMVDTTMIEPIKLEASTVTDATDATPKGPAPRKEITWDDFGVDNPLIDNSPTNERY